MIKIWNPRWHDRKVLIAKYKVKEGNNEIIFTKSEMLKDKIFAVDSLVIKKCPLESNGKIPCYAVPIEELR